MIAVKTIYSVVCDKCGLVLETNAASARIARESARRKGWREAIREGQERNYCPACKWNYPDTKEYYGG